MLNTLEWPILDLARRVDRALDVAEAAISLVSMESPRVNLDALEAPRDKVIAETAMFLRAATAVPASSAPSLPERAHELARALLPYARHPRVAIGVALHPALARDYSGAHFVLAKVGYPNQEFDEIVTTALAESTATARERLPHRELEQAWLATLAGGSPPPEALVARTALIRGIDLLTGIRDDVYAFTHALMYATDFGNHRPRLLRSTSHVLAIARSALVGALDDDDFDLAGELLMTWPFLGAQWDWSSSLAFAVLASVEDQVGVLPSLAINRVTYEQQPLESRQQYITAVVYHTAYVMGLLCSVILSQRSYPETLRPTSCDSATFAEELLAKLAADGKRRQWLQYVEVLPSAVRMAGSSFLLDIALRRAVRRLDLAEVAHLLQAAIEHQVVLSPLCVQAAALLRRLAAFSTPIGNSADVNKVE